MPSYRKLPSGLWQATVYMPNGKRDTQTDRLKKVVKDWAIAEEARYKAGDHRDPRAGRIKVAEWHARRTGGRVLQTPTGKKNASMWRTHCEPRWGDWPMDAITRQDGQNWVHDLMSTRRARHKGKTVDGGDEDEVPFLSAGTIADIVHIMTGDYKAAIAEHPPIVVYNPFAALELPLRDGSAVVFYEHDEAAALYEAVGDGHGAQWRVLTELGTEVGPRLGEMYGLHADRVDLRRGMIGITRVMTRDGIREYAKSKMSHRVVPIMEPLTRDIGQLLGVRRAWRGECTCPKILPNGTRKPGTGPCPGLVFRAPSGGPIDDNKFRNQIWYPAVEAAGIRRFPPSVMRHTAASWLVQDGVPLFDVQALLGHEDYSTTQRYAHLAPDAHVKVVESWRRRRHARVTHGSEEAHSASRGMGLSPGSGWRDLNPRPLRPERSEDPRSAP